MLRMLIPAGDVVCLSEHEVDVQQRLSGDDGEQGGTSGEILNCFETSSPPCAELIVISPLEDMPKYTGTIIAVLLHAASHYGL